MNLTYHICTMYSRYWDTDLTETDFLPPSQPLELAIWMERHKAAHAGKREFTDSDNCPMRNKVMKQKVRGKVLQAGWLLRETSLGGDSLENWRGVWSGE